MCRGDILNHCRALVSTTPLPVSADLEKGIGDSPDSSAETVRAAADIGLAGCSDRHVKKNRRPPVEMQEGRVIYCAGLTSPAK